jgi:tRNA pseudouridine38-40 synthase
MTKYAAIIAYEGTAYYGWQAQPTVPSIELTLKKVFQKTIGTPFCLVAASRTDAGVHALGQVIMFKHALAIEPERLKKIINDSLPQDIMIKELVQAHSDFHPWYNVKEKEYIYSFSLVRPLPEKSKFVWYCRSSVDIERLTHALSFFVGTHDFTAFATIEKDLQAVTIKTVCSIACSYVPEYTYWHIKITGPSFLRHMIRRIVGAAIFIAQHQTLSLDIITQTLVQKKRIIEFPTAPAQGLLLHTITYDKGLQ